MAIFATPTFTSRNAWVAITITIKIDFTTVYCAIIIFFCRYWGMIIALMELIKYFVTYVVYIITLRHLYIYYI